MADVYKIQNINGLYEYVETKDAAIAVAIRMADVEPGTSEDDLFTYWGISIILVSDQVADSLDLG